VVQSVVRSLYRAEAGAVPFSLGRERIAIERAEVDRLVRALRQSERVPAASIGEEISAQALTGRVELRLSEAELDALVSTLEDLGGITADRSSLRRLLVLGRALRDVAHAGRGDEP
jgi:hypothetical protein